MQFHILGVLEVLNAVVDNLPSPALALMEVDGPFLGRIVDSWYGLEMNARFVLKLYITYFVFCILYFVCRFYQSCFNMCEIFSLVLHGSSMI